MGRGKKKRISYGLLPNRGGGGGGGGGEKKPEKMWSFAKLGGGEVSDGSKMPNFYFGKVFFQLACRIILGPPKHVLHLV